MGSLQVGAARVCIDPPREAYPFPSNFGMCDARYDSCHVRALAVGNGARTILFVVYELSDLPKVADLEEILAEASGIPAQDVILSITHNHTSPLDQSKFPAPEEKLALYRQIEIDAGSEAAKQAVSSMRPAKYGFDTIDSFCNVNRDLRTRFGFWVEGPDYAGYSDRRLAVMKFVDAQSGKVIAALLNYGCHATCAFVQKDADGLVKTSGNYTGITSRFVEDYYGDGMVAVWTSGCAGNQDPVLFDYDWYEYPDGYVTKIAQPDGSGYVHMEALGRRQGADAVTCLEGMSAERTEMPIVYKKSVVPVPARRRAADGAKSAPFGVRMGGEGPRTDFSAPVMPELPAYEPDPGVSVDYTLNVLRLGEVAVILTSGELYAQIGRDMIAASASDESFVITHIPGKGGYTLDASSKDHKTFEAFGPVEPGAADEPLIRRTAELTAEAFAEEK